MAETSPRASAAPKKRRRLLFRVLRIIGFSLLGVVVLALTTVLGAYIALQTRGGRAFLLDKLAPVLSTVLPGEISVGAISEARLGEISLRDVVIRDPDGKEVIRVGEARVRPNVRALLRGDIDLASVVAKDVRVALRTSERGTLTIIDAFVREDPDAADAGAGPISVFVRKIRIERGTVVLDLLGDPPVVLRDVAIRGNVRVTEETRVVVERLDFRSERGDTSLVRGKALSASYGNGLGSPSRIRADLRGGEDAIALSASLRNPPAATDDLLATEVHAHVALSPLTTRMLDAFGYGALRADLPQSLRADIKVSGALNDLRTISTFMVGDETISLNARYDMDGESRARVCTEGATLSRFYASLPEQALRGCVGVTMGPYSAEEMPVRVTVVGAKLDATPLPDVVLSAMLRLNDEHIEILSLALPNAAAATPPRLDLTGRIGFDGAIMLDLVMRGFTVRDEPAIEAIVGNVRGAVHGHAIVRLAEPETADAPSRMNVALDLEVRDLGVSSIRARHLTLAARADGTTAAPRFDVRSEIEGFGASSFRMKHVALHAHGSSAAVDLDVSGEIDDRRIARVHAALRSHGTTWSGIANASAGPSNEQWQLAAEGLAYDTASGGIRVRRAVLAHDESRLEASASISGGGALEASVQIPKLVVHDLLRALSMPIAGFRAEVSGSATAAGTTRIPTAHVELEVSDATYQGLEDVHAELALDYRRTDATVTSRIALGESGELAIDGEARWPRPMPIDQVMENAELAVTLTTEALALDLVTKLAPSVVGVAGELDGRVDVTGTIAAPTIALDLTVQNAVVPGLPLQSPELEITLEAQWDETLVATLAAEDVAGPLANAEVRADLATTALIEGAIDLSTIGFELEAALPERRLDTLPIETGTLRDRRARVSATVSVSHVPGRPLGASLEGHLRTEEEPASTEEPEEGSDTNVCGTGAVDIALIGALERGRTTLRLGVTTNEREAARVEIAAVTPVDAWLRGEGSPTLDAELEGHVDEVELDELPIVCTYADGRLSGTISGTNLGRENASVTAHFEAPALVFAEDAPVSITIDAECSSRGAEASVAIHARDGGRGDVSVKLPFAWGENGMSPTVPDGALDAHARFDALSLEPIAGLTPIIRHRAGKIDGRLDVTGTLSNPTPNGDVRLSDVSLIMPGLEQRLSDLEAHVTLSPTQIVVHTLRARDVHGRLSLSGEAHFDGQVPQRLSVELEAHDFPVRQAGVIIAEVSSRATLALRRDRDALRGELEFQSLDVAMPDELQTSVQALEENPDIVYLDSYPPGWDPPEVIEPEEAEATTVVEDDSPFVPTFFHIDLERPFWIRRSDFAIALRAQLDLGVVEEGVRLSGVVHTERGFIELLGASFDIEEGTVRFPGGTRIDPVLDLTAIANKGRPNQVSVHIKGTIADLELTFLDRSQRELTAGLAVQCITTAQCSELGDIASGGDSGSVAEQQAQSALASLTVGLLTAAARHGLGDAVPRIAVSTGGGFEAVTARVGFEANKLIPKFLRNVVLSLYIEGFISNDSANDNREAVQETGSQGVAGGFLIELRHPRSLVTRGRYAPRSGWSLDVTWQR